MTLAACAPAAPTVDAAAEEAAIRALDAQWEAAANRQDLDGTVAIYATNGATMWPDAPTSHGTSEIRAAWAEMFKVPGINVQFLPDRIEIAQAGDMATEEGRAVVGMTTPAGAAVDTAKYLIVWKKENGAWKVAYDVYNMSKPAAPTAPVVK